jgi:hypothetical protein
VHYGLFSLLYVEVGKPNVQREVIRIAQALRSRCKPNAKHCLTIKIEIKEMTAYLNSPFVSQGEEKDSSEKFNFHPNGTLK